MTRARAERVPRRTGGMRNMKIRYLIPIGLFVVLVAVFARGLQLDPTRVPSPLIDKPAPDFDLPTLYDPDKRFTKETLLGEVSLYNVFASWCTACRLEHPLLMELKNAGKVPVYGLNYKDKRENALQWLNDLGDPYAGIAYDFPGRSAIDWGVYGVPETFVLDHRGMIRYKQIGPMDREALETKILPLVERLQTEARQRPGEPG